jgi:hypothetical protein
MISTAREKTKGGMNDFQADKMPWSGNPAAADVFGRFSEIHSLVRRPVSSAPWQETINGWLDNCFENHDRCGSRGDKTLPSRLIDISSASHFRLVETQPGNKGRYVALSYCWGLKRNNESIHKVKLKHVNLMQLKRGLDQSSMTLTHLEAIRVARTLGHQYIWIDALCIKQDSKHDWSREASMVPMIYGNAELTIMAGRSDDSREGFLDVSRWYKPAAKPVELPYNTRQPSRPNAAIWLGLERSADVGPTDERAWCFQESVMSRRIVTFGKEQLMFQCRERSFVEANGFMEGFKDTGGVQDAWYKLAVLEQHTWPKGTPAALPLILNQWYPLTETYSRRSLFDPMDCYAAFAGVARKFQTALAAVSSVKHPRYLAGLWEIDMLKELMWRSSRIDQAPRSTDAELRKPLKWLSPPQISRVVERAPSWSWMALEGSITMEMPGSHRDKPYCSPASQDGSWAPRDWGLDLVIDDEITKALPFSIGVKGRLRQVRVATYMTVSKRDLFYARTIRGSFKGPRPNTPFFNRDHFSDPAVEKNMEKHGVVLMDGELMSNFKGVPVATGLFDLAEGKPRELWAIPVWADSKGWPTEGLLLARKQNGSFSRLGVFWVQECEAFMQTQEQIIQIE